MHRHAPVDTVTVTPLRRPRWIVLRVPYKRWVDRPKELFRGPQLGRDPELNVIFTMTSDWRL
jgi:hypothetical protein